MQFMYIVHIHTIIDSQLQNSRSSKKLTLQNKTDKQTIKKQTIKKHIENIQLI